VRWILLSLVIALAALAVLAVVLLRLWRQVKALMKQVDTASDALGRATGALERAQADGPLAGRPGAGALGRGSSGSVGSGSVGSGSVAAGSVGSGSRRQAASDAPVG
jgi:hypothetical protein